MLLKKNLVTQNHVVLNNIGNISSIEKLTRTYVFNLTSISETRTVRPCFSVRHEFTAQGEVELLCDYFVQSTCRKVCP